MPALIVIAIVIATVMLALPSSAGAHQLRPAIVTITFNPDQTYDVTIALNIEALIAGIGPQHQDTDDSPDAETYNALRRLPPAELRARIDGFGVVLLGGIHIEIDGQRVVPYIVSVEVPDIVYLDRQRVSMIRLRGQTPERAQQLVWSWAEAFGSSAVRVRRADKGIVQSSFLNPGATSEPFLIGAPLKPRATLKVAGEYLAIGFTHIVPKGLDHILFVLGIFLLSVAWRPLLYQVTAFTIAHTITLGLSLYGYLSLSPSIVEPLIAASIVYVGVENIFTPTLKPWRVFVVFGFGLLHGMGFAGVLTEIGLPKNEFVNALISFNVGVELGQLAVIVVAWLAVAAFRNASWYRRVIVIPGSAAIALTGGYWAVERVFG